MQTMIKVITLKDLFTKGFPSHPYAFDAAHDLIKRYTREHVKANIMLMNEKFGLKLDNLQIEELVNEYSSENIK